MDIHTLHSKLSASLEDDYPVVRIDHLEEPARFDPQNFIVHLGLSSRNPDYKYTVGKKLIDEYREFCKLHNLNTWSHWGGNVDFYGVRNNQATATNDPFFDYHSRSEKNRLCLFPSAQSFYDFMELNFTVNKVFDYEHWK